MASETPAIQFQALLDLTVLVLKCKSVASLVVVARATISRANSGAGVRRFARACWNKDAQALSSKL